MSIKSLMPGDSSIFDRKGQRDSTNNTPFLPLFSLFLSSVCRASDDPEKTNTTYVEDSQPTQGKEDVHSTSV